MKRFQVSSVLGFGTTLLLSIAPSSVLGSEQPASMDVAFGGIVITELMPNVDDDDIDWIELLNVTDTDIDLRGCSLSDEDGDHFVVEQSLSIAPGDYAVIASGASAEHGAPPGLRTPALRFSANRFQLAAAPDQVILTCGDQVIDKVSYRRYEPGPATRSRGWQLEPGSLNATANDEAGRWCYTVLSDDYVYGAGRVATPGAANPICVEVSLPYVHINDQDAVLIDGIDFDTTLRIAEEELAERTSTSELTIWVLRDQKIDAAIAATISRLYFQYIEGLYETEPFTVLDWNHAVWHFAWAISNLYRNGDESVKVALQGAYDDAVTRPETLERHRYIATDNVLNPEIMMGDIHDLGHGFATTHIVVPGNPEYIQNYEDYLDNKRTEFMRTVIHTLFVIKSSFDEWMR